MEIFVHDTAFMIAYYRAQNELMSRDPFAKLWLRPTLKNWADQFAEHVSPHDGILHCFRNRFFLEELEELSSNQNRLLLINLGAGFSMYPYVLPEHVKTIEVDFPEIAEYKQEKIKKFTAEKKVPTRSVLHKAANITTKEGQQELAELIATYPNSKKAILIEGVFFFLTLSQIASVLSFCRNLLKEGDLLFCVSYETPLETSPVFDKLTTYFSEVLKSEENPFTVLSNSYYEELDSFDLLKKSSSVEVGEHFQGLPNDLNKQDVLNEFFYVLKK